MLCGRIKLILDFIWPAIQSVNTHTFTSRLKAFRISHDQIKCAGYGVGKLNS